MVPVDPGENWLAPGITGLARQREWDAVATAEAPGTPGDEVTFVALEDGRLLVEDDSSGADPTPLAEALTGSLARPYRARAVRHEDVWAVGGSAIAVGRLDPDPGGEDLELTWDGELHVLYVDGIPVEAARADALVDAASARESGPYAAHAHRLDGDLFELLVLPL